MSVLRPSSTMYLPTTRGTEFLQSETVKMLFLWFESIICIQIHLFVSSLENFLLTCSQCKRDSSVVLCWLPWEVEKENRVISFCRNYLVLTHFTVSFHVPVLLHLCHLFPGSIFGNWYERDGPSSVGTCLCGGLPATAHSGGATVTSKEEGPLWVSENVQILFIFIFSLCRKSANLIPEKGMR